jgi:hypothetical protein
MYDRALHSSGPGARALDPDDPDDLADLREGDEPEAPPLWLSLGSSVGIDEQRTRASFMLLLGTQLDRALAPRVRGADYVTVDAEGSEPRQRRVREPLRGPLARGVVEQTEQRAQVARSLERLDDLASRSRASGLLPELRLRVAHVLNDTASLSPTAYDPERLTASAGASLWLEGRATFRLDRLLRGDDEPAIERLRLDRERQRRALEDRALEALALWRRAKAKLDDPDADERTLAMAEADVAVAEATLDVLTAGWFSRRALELEPDPRELAQLQSKSSESLTRVCAVAVAPSESERTPSRRAPCRAEKRWASQGCRAGTGARRPCRTRLRPARAEIRR